jgi:hypothetical protein
MLSEQRSASLRVFLNRQIQTAFHSAQKPMQGSCSSCSRSSRVFFSQPGYSLWPPWPRRFGVGSAIFLLYSTPPHKRWGSVAELTYHLQGSTPYGIRFSHKTYRPSPTKDVTKKDPPLIRGPLIGGCTVSQRDTLKYLEDIHPRFS